VALFYPKSHSTPFFSCIHRLLAGHISLGLLPPISPVISRVFLSFFSGYSLSLRIFSAFLSGVSHLCTARVLLIPPPSWYRQVAIMDVYPEFYQSVYVPLLVSFVCIKLNVCTTVVFPVWIQRKNPTPKNQPNRLPPPPVLNVPTSHNKSRNFSVHSPQAWGVGSLFIWFLFFLSLSTDSGFMR